MPMFAQRIGGHLRPDGIRPIGKRSKGAFVEAVRSTFLTRQHLQGLPRNGTWLRETPVDRVCRGLQTFG